MREDGDRKERMGRDGEFSAGCLWILVVIRREEGGFLRVLVGTSNWAERDRMIDKKIDTERQRVAMQGRERNKKRIRERKKNMLFYTLK